MGLIPGFSRQDIRNYIQRRLTGLKRAVEMRLKRTGEEFIILARESGAYMDRTGNLRNSAFYIVLYNGVVLAEDYSSNGSEGAIKAQAFADKISADFQEGYALICGAGMEYAAAVEANGKDVITGSTQIIETILKQAMDRIRAQANG